ncbi:uncharacterized protein LOC134242927 [Saccostrea cucullata]|uniref:uncharacterized protein LOC134242927 n=1 Tax=Saccostrea cuccullata TaxID=36930 RepID=UPI002ED34E65
MRLNVNIVAYGKTISGLYPYYALSDWDFFPRGAPTAASVLQTAISTPLFDLNMADKARDFAFLHQILNHVLGVRQTCTTNSFFCHPHKELSSTYMSHYNFLCNTSEPCQQFSRFLQTDAFCRKTNLTCHLEILTKERQLDVL